MYAAPTTTNKEHGMMMHTTLTQLRDLKLDGLAAALEEQLGLAGMAAMSFEERLALLVDREVHWRSDRKLQRLLKQARLKYAQAAIEDIDHRPTRGLDRRAVMSLALGDWVTAGHSVLITGPTGAGKSWLACALAQHACRRGHTVLYQRVPRLQEGAAHPARQRHLRQMAAAIGQDGRATARRLGHGRHRQRHALGPAGDHR